MQHVPFLLDPDPHKDWFYIIHPTPYRSLLCTMYLPTIILYLYNIQLGCGSFQLSTNYYRIKIPENVFLLKFICIRCGVGWVFSDGRFGGETSNYMVRRPRQAFSNEHYCVCTRNILAARRHPGKLMLETHIRTTDKLEQRGYPRIKELIQLS